MERVFDMDSGEEAVVVEDESRCVYCERLRLSSTVSMSKVCTSDDGTTTYQFSCSNYHKYRTYCINKGPDMLSRLKRAHASVPRTESKFETAMHEYNTARMKHVYEVYEQLRNVPNYIEPDTGVVLDGQEVLEFHWIDAKIFLEIDLKRNVLMLSHSPTGFEAKLYDMHSDNDVKRMCKRFQRYLELSKGLSVLKKLPSKSSIKEKIPYENKCLECDSNFLYRKGVMSTTIADYAPIVIDGVQHTHDANSITCDMSCSNGHLFEVYTEGYNCSLCNVVKKSYVRLLKD